MRTIIFLVLLAVAAVAAGAAASGFPGVAPRTAGANAPVSLYFDDSDPALIVLGNSAFYEIGLHKANGGIAYITDKATGQQVSAGSRYSCLWGAVFPGASPEYVGGCSYDANGANHFTYTWLPATHTLRLDYSPDPAAERQATAQVTLTISDEAWIDLHLLLQNNWGATLDWALFPSDLMFVEDGIQEALLPILPGLVLEPEFFANNLSYTATYPGYPGLFADYPWLESDRGRFAMYSLVGRGSLHPLTLGFIHDEQFLSDSMYVYHSFGARTAQGGAWESPTVRLRIGQPIFDTLLAYRIENGIEAFASLNEKLGARYTQVVQSPLLKADAVQLGLPFAQYPAQILDHLPSPAIFHPVAFQPGGHDQNYPDFLPPAPAWGSTADFTALAQAAQERGLLFMPYTNPTWWDDESPTLQDLPEPLVITDVAVLDDQGHPMFEYYGPNGGYVVSPYAPFVLQRLEALVAQMTGEVHTDLLFEDQVGARPWMFDQNPAAPDPTAYIEGWLAHTHAYSTSLLMTELGFDRLAESEVGFHGSLLLPQRNGSTDSWWGADAWHPYPLALILARDKTLFYQHDLAPETFTFDKATLTWNLALGYMLSYDLVQSEFGGGLDSPWLGLVAAFQQRVLARYASERITGFTNVQEEVTQTSFETFTALANWSQDLPYTHDEYILPPQGVLIQNADGTVIAGVFTHYHGAPLSSGEHYLIEERTDHQITVRQPVGADTNLTVGLLPGWSSASRLVAWAYNAQGQALGTTPVTVSASGASFAYQQQYAGQDVAWYTITTYQVFLPVIQKWIALEKAPNE